MNLTFTLIAISYFAVISMVLMTFRFVRDRKIKNPEYFSLDSFNLEAKEKAS